MKPWSCWYLKKVVGRVAQIRLVPHVSFFETWVLAAEQMCCEPRNFRAAKIGLTGLKRVKNSDIVVTEVPFIPGRYNQTMNTGRGGNHRVFE